VGGREKSKKQWSAQTRFRGKRVAVTREATRKAARLLPEDRWGEKREGMFEEILSAKLWEKELYKKKND